MIIPWVRIQWISDEKGYGLFAIQDIPKGTLTFVQDGLDIVIPEEDLNSINPSLKEYVEKYSYEDFLGNRIVSWDLGKYMNHDDEANTLSTGYGFELAVRDIKKGEEVTDDYRIFSTHHDTENWHVQTSQKELIPEFPADLEEMWDQKVQNAISSIFKVEQPLKDFVDSDVWKRVKRVSENQEEYLPVRNAFPLRYHLHLGNLKS